MKKALNISLVSGFTLLYACFLSLGLECFLVLLEEYLARCFFGGKPMLEEYPRLVPFCLIVGLVALLSIFILIGLNIFATIKLKIPQTLWIVEVICSLLLSLPMLWFWHRIIEYLRIIW